MYIITENTEGGEPPEVPITSKALHNTGNNVAKVIKSHEISQNTSESDLAQELVTIRA